MLDLHEGVLEEFGCAQSVSPHAEYLPGDSFTFTRSRAQAVERSAMSNAQYKKRCRHKAVYQLKLLRAARRAQAEASGNGWLVSDAVRAIEAAL